MISDLFWWLLHSQCLKHSQTMGSHMFQPSTVLSNCHGSTNPFPPLCIEMYRESTHPQHIAQQPNEHHNLAKNLLLGIALAGDRPGSQIVKASDNFGDYLKIPITISLASVSDLFGYAYIMIRTLKTAAIEKQHMILKTPGITGQPSTGFHPAESKEPKDVGNNGQ